MLIIKMGGMLDCSAGMEDEIDVANHSGHKCHIQKIHVE